MHIDLNCDLGESFGRFKIGVDEDIIPLVSSVNIACGFHAGDPSTMRKTVQLAKKHGVAIGAHPGLPDLQGFGRRVMEVSEKEVYEMVLYQIGALAGIARAEGTVVRHVKPHGALYNMAAQHQGIADAIAKAVYRFDSSLMLFGLSGSELVHSGKRVGLTVVQEVFSDRTYQANGELTPRSLANSLIKDKKTALTQVLRMVKEGMVRSQQGSDIHVQADTICIHGDGANALTFAHTLHQKLQQEGITIAPPH
ncbi:MAG: 5-oxoprolinase subunit PxpA [Bacillota bacterium]|nr:5-oxoprolinase subunit PxpA [Bacillota bacterium]